MNFASSLVQGRTLSAEDQDFVSILLKELDRFQCGAPKDRALMFEPLHGFQRYLIHKVTESFPRLTSFSINDEKGKRTVVCFKNNKKKDQNAQYQIEPIQQGGGGAAGTAADMADFHQRGRKPMPSRTPVGSYPASAVSGSGSRYRESARSSTKNNDSRASTAPRPLRRPAEASSRGSSRPRTTLREKPHQGGRSLSSHSSPVRHNTMDNRHHRGHIDDEDDIAGGYDDVDGGAEKYHTDHRSAGRSKRNSRQSEEDGSGDRRRGRASCPSSPRRSSRRAPSTKRGKSRENSLGRTTAADSGYDRRSEASLDRRMRGLHLEGKVVNGDNNAASDDETDDDDVDSDHRATTTHNKDYDTPPPTTVTSSSNRRRSSSCRKSATSTRSRARSPPSPPPPVRSNTMKATKSSSSRRDPSVTKSNGKSSSSSMKYKSSKKQEEVVYTSSNDDDDISDDVSEESDDESLHGEEPPSYDSIGRSSLSKARRNLERIKRTSSDRQQRAESSSSGGGARRKIPEARKPSRSQSVPRKSRDVASGSTRNAGTQYEHSKPDEVKNKRSSSVKVSKSKDRSGRSKKAMKEKALSNDTLLDGSNTTVYMGLPVDKESEPETTSSKHHQRSSSKSRRRESEKSKSSSKSKSVEAESDHSSHHRHHRQRASTPPPMFTSSEIPTTTDDLEPPSGGNHENDLSPDMLLAFREFLQQQAAQQQQQQAATSAPTVAGATTIPAELAHQLYLSYLSAYYAGATGVWPPPAPPAYIMPQHVRGGGGSNAQQFPFFQPSPFPNFMMPMDENKGAGSGGGQQNSGYYPYLATNFGGGSDHDPYQSHSSLNNQPPSSTNPQPSAPNAPSSCGEDYAPSPAAYQHDGAAPHVRRYSLERACQSDSCKSSACDDDQPMNNSSSTTSHQHSTGTPVTSNAGGSMSDASCNSATTRSSEVAVSSTSRGNVVVYVRSRANSNDSRRSAAGGSTGFSAPEDTVPSSASPAPSDKKSVRRSKSKQLHQRGAESSGSSSNAVAASAVKSSPTSMDKKRGEALHHHQGQNHNSAAVIPHNRKSSSSSSNNCCVTTSSSPPLLPPPLPLPPTEPVLKPSRHHNRHDDTTDHIPLITGTSTHGSNHSLHERGATTTATNAAAAVLSNLPTQQPPSSANVIHNANASPLQQHDSNSAAGAEIDSLPPPPDVSESASCGFSHEDLRMTSRHHAPLAMMDDDATTTTTTDDRLSHVSGSGSHVSIIDLVGNLPQSLLKKGCPRHDSLSDTDDDDVAGGGATDSSDGDQGSNLPPPPPQLLTPEVSLKSPVFEARISTDGSDQEAAASSTSVKVVHHPPNYEEALSTTCSRDGFDDEDDVDKAEQVGGGSRERLTPSSAVSSTTSGGSHRLLQPPPPARTTSLGSVETNPTTTEESSTPVSSPSGNGSTGNGSDGDAAPSSNRNNDIAANAANIVKQVPAPSKSATTSPEDRKQQKHRRSERDSTQQRRRQQPTTSSTLDRNDDPTSMKKKKSIKHKFKKMFGSSKKSNTLPTNYTLSPSSTNVDDDIQDEKYDYYNWDPKKEKWQEERFRRFVEIYGFSPDMTDHQLAEQMRVFRGLRMNRIGHQHALCLLPTVEDAEKMLEHNFRFFNVRTLASATTKSKEKAERKLDDKDRGRSSTLSLSSNTSRMTNASVANRMILNSLGRRSTLPSSQQQGGGAPPRTTSRTPSHAASSVDEK